MIFGLVVAAHIARMLTESHALARDPSYLTLTILSGALAIWAWRVYRRLS
jgi:hypothetical protein